MGAGRDDRLFYTDDDEANHLIASDPMALLIGFSLDQQVPVQKAFIGPLELKRRVGTIEARHLAEMDSERLADAFRQRPALHRYPAAMAERVQALARHVAERYSGEPGRIWAQAADARDLKTRLAALPGFGEMKVAGMLAVLGKRLGVRPSGWEEVAPRYPTLGDVDSAQALADYQAKKRAHKATLRAAGQRFDPRAEPPAG